jgi:hypothetical protein
MPFSRANFEEFKLLRRLNPLSVEKLSHILPILPTDHSGLILHGLVSLVNLPMAPLVNHTRFIFDSDTAEREEATLSGGLLLHSHTALRDMLHALHEPESPGWFFDVHTSTFVPFAVRELPEIVYICNEAFGRETFFTDDCSYHSPHASLFHAQLF